MYRLLKTVVHKTNSSEICFGKLIHQVIWKIGKRGVVQTTQKVITIIELSSNEEWPKLVVWKQKK